MEDHFDGQSMKDEDFDLSYITLDMNELEADCNEQALHQEQTKSQEDHSESFIHNLNFTITTEELRDKIKAID